MSELHRMNSSIWQLFTSTTHCNIAPTALRREVRDQSLSHALKSTHWGREGGKESMCTIKKSHLPSEPQKACHSRSLV